MTRSWKNGWVTIIATALCAVGMTGCTNYRSCLDPSGDHVFTPPPAPTAASPAVNASNSRYFDDPLNQLPWDDVAVLIEPRETVVPVGSEVVLIAGVAGADGYLRTNRRLEWSIASGGVGHFVAVEKNGMLDLMLGDFNWPRKVDATFAIGSTSRENVRLNRGTPSTDDDKFVQRGQGWITLTSPVEGTSHVTVVAPEVYGWDARTKSATVHFVDAVVQYPPPAINPAGTKHVFTTTITRFTNQSPCENWLVRYEIVGGPAAGFLPDGASMVEVRTNSAGQACAEIVQKQPASGVNKISIQAIRPADAPGSGGQRLVVGNGTTTKTWSAPDLAVRVTGPATASIGTTIAYQVDLSNPGDLPAKEVTASIDVPEGLTFQSANPTADVAGRQLRWRLGDIGARQQRPISVTFRAERQGSAITCCDATAAGGIKARDCRTTTISQTAAVPPATTPPAMTSPTGAPLDVRIVPVDTAVKVGDSAQFEISITNRTQAAIPTTTLIKVRLDPGLSHPAAVENNIIKRNLDQPIQPGETRRFGVSAKVLKPGQLYESVEVTVPNAAPITAQASITATGVASAAPTSPTAPMTVTVTGPSAPVNVGNIAMFAIEVKNTGSVDLRNVKIVDRCDTTLDRTQATVGWRVDKDLLVWDIDTLPAGKSTTVKIQCTCEAVAARAYHRATASLTDGGRVEGEGFVEIIARRETPLSSTLSPSVPAPSVPAPALPAAKGLSLSVVGLFSPVRPGKELTYEIRVSNNDTKPYRQIAVTATVPSGMTPIRLGTVGAKIDGQVIQFDAKPELAPGESATYRARVLAKQEGKFHLKVELTTPDQQKPLSVDAEETEVSN
jgi:uncharacterized repeat protein (TIGR01451 family)